ncbi:MAG: hypothetical protein L0241_14750 [Planctomycetia bacterium]|nr:hypothetical protein [Planctomycetia bacterium]
MVSQHGRWIRLEMQFPESAYKPLGFAAGDANLYRYVGNSPTNATDPSGLITWKYLPIPVIPKPFERPEYRAYLVMHTTVFFDFQETETLKWMAAEKKEFVSKFIEGVKKTWNTHLFYIVANRGGGPKRDEPLTWIPYLQVEAVEGAAISGADFIVEIDPTNQRGRKENVRANVMFLFRDSCRTRSYTYKDVQYKQFIPAHEFGHLLGFEHPGGKGEELEKYTADPHAIMGLGSKVRIEYLSPWIDHLRTKFKGDAPFVLASTNILTGNEEIHFAWFKE